MLALFIQQGLDLDGQAKQIDKALGIGLVVDIVFAKGCDFFGIHSPSKEMAWVGEMLVKGLSGSIEENGDEAVKAAEAMSEDIDDVMSDLAKDMQTALPTDFNVEGSVGSAISSAAKGAVQSGMSLILNITNFNNYSSEDIEQLTNEIMVTAGQFAKRKGVVFA